MVVLCAFLFGGRGGGWQVEFTRGDGEVKKREEKRRELAKRQVRDERYGTGGEAARIFHHARARQATGAPPFPAPPGRPAALRTVSTVPRGGGGRRRRAVLASESRNAGTSRALPAELNQCGQKRTLIVAAFPVGISPAELDAGVGISQYWPQLVVWALIESSILCWSQSRAQFRELRHWLQSTASRAARP